jgi:O-acetyl-ADP-ribose deacetylase (regulator of RNase III)
MPAKPSQILKLADSLGIWQTESIAMRGLRTGRGGVFWDRAEERMMHHIGSEALSRFVAERHYSWLESYMEWLEGKEERAQYHALLEEELASLRG